MNFCDDSESRFRQAVRLLREGGLVIAPTETFYGIIADACSRSAVERLIDLKERDYGKPIPLIAGDTITVGKAAAVIPPVFRPLAEKFWPGPLTLVLHAANGFPEGVTAGTGSIGIRIPAQSPALDLAKLMGAPLTATSANFSGQAPARHIGELDEKLVEKVDLVIDGGWTPGVQPSTVLNLTMDPPEVLRRGAMSVEIERFIKERYEA